MVATLSRGRWANEAKSRDFMLYTGSDLRIIAIFMKWTQRGIWYNFATYWCNFGQTRWVDENVNILSHPGPEQYRLPRGHIMVVFNIRASYRLPSLSCHDNGTSLSRDTIWPWKFKAKGKGQRYPSQRSIQLLHFLFVSHQLDQPFLRYGK